MGAFTYIETDTGTNVDIHAATAVGAYTSTGDKLIMVDVSIDAVAGNGDYVMYVTRQIDGSGSAYRILPQTTMAAASGLTAISAQSGWITVRNGDVLTCYVVGLAGDTSTPDWTTRWFELAGVTAAAVADAVLDEAPADHTSAGSLGKAVADILTDTGTTLDGKIDTIDTNVDAILADTGTDGVKLANTQGAITWAQQKIVANVSQQGALDIYNSHQDGSGIYSHATTGAKFAGAGTFLGYGTGLEIKGDKYGLHIANIGNNMEAALRIVNQLSNGLYIAEQGTTGYRVQGYVSGYDRAILTNVEEAINEALNVTNALLTNELDEFTDSAPKAMQLPPEEGV